MKIVKPSIEVTFYAPEDGRSPEQAIEIAGRTCYKSEDRVTTESSGKFVRMLRDRGHHAMLEFGYATARIVADRGLCYDDQTEVLTYDGWKKFQDVEDSDSFLTMDMKTKKAEYQRSIHKTVEPWTGQMICGQSTMVDFVVTPNHRMVWFHYDSRVNRRWKIDKAKDVEGRRVKFQRGLFGEMPGESVPTEFPQQRTLAFARFMGMFITDGSLWQGVSEAGVHKTGGRVTLVQTKAGGRRYIKRFLDELKWSFKEKDHGFVLNNTVLYNFLRKDFPVGERKSLSGRVPSWIRHAPRNYIRAFLEGAVMGDGNIHKKNKHEVIYTASPDMAGNYQELYMKAGLCATVRIDDRVGESRVLNGNVITNNVIGYIVSVTKRTNEHLFNRKHWFRKYYDGNVYCVTVPNGTLYVRRNGKAFWSGNTHELVRHRLCSFAQESTRFCNYGKGKFGKEITVVEQPGLEEAAEGDRVQYVARKAWENAMRASERAYLALLDAGVKPQFARSVLPIGLKSEIVIGANLREWRHIFEMRCARAAHPIIRGVMLKALREFCKKMPALYEDLEERFIGTE